MQRIYQRKTVALIGNPNVGKSTIFNQLTGSKQHTGNWTGKTVDIAKSNYIFNDTNFEIVDLPGAYSLFNSSPEEKITEEYLIKEQPDLVIAVCDASGMEKSLNIVLQTLEICPNVILCVNLMDEAQKKGINVDIKGLETILGINVIGINAHSKNDIVLLKEILCKPKIIDKPYKSVEKNLSSHKKVEIMRNLYAKSSLICSDTVRVKNDFYLQKQIKTDKLFTGKFSGWIVMFLLLFIILWITVVGANYPSDILSLFFRNIESFLHTVFAKLNIPRFVEGPLLEGVFRVTGWVVSVMFPPTVIFFSLFSLLEECGYLPRVAFNLDYPMKKCGACGRQCLTMCMGLGCNAVGVTGARIINSKKERLNAIVTNSFMPCNGRFPTIIALVGIFFSFGLHSPLNSFVSAIGILFTIVFGVLNTMMISKFLSSFLLKQDKTSLILELPPFRKPQIIKTLSDSFIKKSLNVLGRAVFVSAPMGAVIWLFANVYIGDTSLLSSVAELIDPISRVFGLDGVIMLSFILSAPANEILLPIIIMSYLAKDGIYDFSSLAELKNILLLNDWTPLTAICVITFSLNHWPCTTTLLTIKKETNSIKWMMLSALIPTVTGLFYCFIINMFGKIIL